MKPPKKKAMKKAARIKVRKEHFKMICMIEDNKTNKVHSSSEIPKWPEVSSRLSSLYKQWMEDNKRREAIIVFRSRPE